jgi:hypothetical protein
VPLRTPVWVVVGVRWSVPADMICSRSWPPAAKDRDLAVSQVPGGVTGPRRYMCMCFDGAQCRAHPITCQSGWTCLGHEPEKPFSELLETLVAVLLRLHQDLFYPRPQLRISPVVPRRCFGTGRISQVRALKQRPGSCRIVCGVISRRQWEPRCLPRPSVFIHERPGHASV